MIRKEISGLSRRWQTCFVRVLCVGSEGTHHNALALGDGVGHRKIVQDGPSEGTMAFLTSMG